MHSIASLATLTALAAVASAGQTFRVDVGNGALRFSPNNTVASPGDVVEFHFFPKNHTVTQGSFNTPCAVGDVQDGFFSGFVPTPSGEANKVFRVTVKDTKPAWFFCSQPVGTHCQVGMVGAINAPETGNTLDLYAANAKNTKSSEVPAGGPKGGDLVANSNGTASSVAGGSTSTVGAPYTTGGYYGGGGSYPTPGTPVSPGSGSNGTVTPPAQQTKNAASSLKVFGWGELIGLVAVIGGVAAYMG